MNGAAFGTGLSKINCHEEKVGEQDIISSIDQDIIFSQYYVSGFMKMVLKNPYFTLVSPLLRSPPSHVKWQKIEKGRE